MRHSFIILFIALVSQAFSQNTPTIVINELNCDNPGGPDNAEFIELFGEPNTTLDSLVLVFFEGDIDQSYLALDLDGYSLDSAGFFVAGSAGTPNVDYVIPNAIISNGPDAIALYAGDASDFPNGMIPRVNQLLEAVVYETSDTEDTTLIALLGLHDNVPNYIQIDETFQLSQPDYSLSRIPDGGMPFEFVNFALRSLTPGTWNQSPCKADSIFTHETPVFCNAQEQALATWFTSGNNESPTFLITDSNNAIVGLTNENFFSFEDFSIGLYRIYTLNYSGLIDSTSLVTGSNIEDVIASECLSLSDNFITISIDACSECDGGSIAIAHSSGPFCNSQTALVEFFHDSSAANDNYLFVVTDSAGTIYRLTSESLSLFDFAPGTYSITGLSYFGEISGLTIGSPLSEVSATICSAASTNSLQITVFGCTTFTPCDKLFISEYLEGLNGTKAIELFNPSENTIDLSEYSIHQYANGVFNATNMVQLSGVLLPMHTYVIANPTQGGSTGIADPAVLQLADLIHPIVNFNGNDAMELRHNDTIIDVIGIVGENPGSSVGWPVDSESTTDVDMVRRFEIQTPVPVWGVSSVQWNTFSNDVISNLGNHFFKRCSEETFGGFLDDEITVSEESNTVTFGIQCIHVNSPISMQIQLGSGTANTSDYVFSIPDVLVFDEEHKLLYLTLTLLDDIEPEGNETILLSLQSDSTLVWFNQQLRINIQASDANCSGGIISVPDALALNQCTDVINAPIEVQVNSDYPINNYLFLLTDTNNVILALTNENALQLDTLDGGIFRIWGLSYGGTLETEGVLPGAHIDFINADECASLSENFLEIVRQECLTYGCDGDSIHLIDGNTFLTLCAGNNHAEIPLFSDSESVDAMYTFFIIDSLNNIINYNDGIWQVGNIAPGSYRVFGISHLSELIDSTITSGMALSGVTSDGCIEHSENYIEVYVYECQEQAPCSRLLISEMIEHTQSNKAIEIYNPTPYPIQLGDYQLKLYANGSPSPSYIQTLEGVLAAHHVFVVGAPSTGSGSIDSSIIAITDLTSQCAEFTGNDAVELAYQGNAIDVIGVVGSDPGGTGWLFGNSSTTNRTLVRRADCSAPSTNWNLSSGQWISYPSNDYSHIGYHESWNCGLNPAPIVGFETSSQTAIEADGAIISIPIQIESVGESFPIEVSISGTATADEDYTINSSIEMNIEASTQEVLLEIALIGDEISEGDETIILTLGSSDDVLFTQSTHTIIIQENVGVKEFEGEEIRIFPNPVVNEFTLQSSLNIHEAILMDTQGRIVQEKKINEQTSKTDWLVNSLQPGPYILKLRIDDRFVCIPIIITR